MKPPQFPNDIATKEWLNSIDYPFTIHNKFFAGQKKFKKIGAWRWDAMLKYKDIIMQHVFDPKQKGVDFGGYHGPIGGYSEIVDIELGNSIRDYDVEELDYIFTSHALEHVKDLSWCLFTMWNVLKDGGKLIIHVPSYQKEVWRKENDPDHHHTFRLGNDPKPKNCYAIDAFLRLMNFNILIAEYTYKCCIFIYAEKKRCLILPNSPMNLSTQ